MFTSQMFNYFTGLLLIWPFGHKLDDDCSIITLHDSISDLSGIIASLVTVSLFTSFHSYSNVCVLKNTWPAHGQMYRSYKHVWVILSSCKAVWSSTPTVATVLHSKSTIIETEKNNKFSWENELIQWWK